MSTLKLLHANDARGRHAPSWYASTAEDAPRAALERHVDTDVCVVGGGYNASQRTLEDKLGRERAHGLWRIAEDARTSIVALEREAGTDLHYRPGIVIAAHRERGVAPLHEEAEHLAREYGHDAITPLDRAGVRTLVASDGYHGGVLDLGAGHLHPLRLAHALARVAERAGAALHERSEVLRVEGLAAAGTPHRGGRDGPVRLVTAGGSVRAERVVLAANGYLDGLVGDTGGLAARVMPINNFILVTEPLGARARALLSGDHAVADTRFVVNYFRRTVDDRLLFGGGESYGYRFPDDLDRRSRRAMLGVFPELRDVAVEHAWGGTLAITPSRLPDVRRVSPRLYAAGGYSGHGVGLAVAAGHAIGAAIDGDAERLALLEALPTGRFPGGARARPALLALAMTGARWLDRL